MTLHDDRRAAVAIMMGILAPIMLGLAALVVDTGFWFIAQTRLQIAADAGAMGAGRLLTISSLKTANDTTSFKPVALAEAQGAAATRLVGTFDTVNGITVTVASDWSKVTVVLTSTGPTYFAKIFNMNAGPTLKATAVASIKTTSPCVLMLGTSGVGIQVDNAGTVTAANCPIGTNSTSNPSIYVNSGTLSGTAINTPGTLSVSNSGSNSVSPSTATSTTSANPESTLSNPTPPACNVTNANYSAYGTYTFTPTGSPPSYTFCGNTIIGGNGSTDTFNPGTYYVVNGDLTFNNASISQASGVSFIMVTTTGYTGTSNFSWTNYSNTSTQFTPATTGPAAAAGIGIWQTCNPNGGQTASFQGGSTLLMSGTVYMPCASVDIGNNAQVSGPLNTAFSFIAKSLYVHGSGALRTSGSGSSAGSGTSAPVLTQ